MKPKQIFLFYFCAFFILCLGPILAMVDADPTTLYFQNQYHKAIDTMPNPTPDVETSYLLGLSYLKLGLMYMEIHPAFLSLARDYYQELNLLPKRIPGQARPSIYTIYYLGLTYLELGDYENAIFALKNFLSQDPSKDFAGYAQCALGMGYYLNGKRSQAEVQFRSVPTESDSVVLCLANVYQHLRINSDQVTQIYQRLSSTSGLHRFHLVASLTSYQGDYNKAIKWIRLKSQVRNTQNWIDWQDQVDDTQQIEFFHPRLFIDIGEVYLRQASNIFAKLIGARPDFDADLHYGRALILFYLQDYNQAVEEIESLFSSRPSSIILSESAQILSAKCHYKLDRRNTAVEIWQRVATDKPIIAVELANAYAEAQLEPVKSAELIRVAMGKIKNITKGRQVTEETPDFYAPVNAFPQREFYRRAGNSVINLSTYANQELQASDLGIPTEAGLIDCAVRIYQQGHIVAYPYTIDEAPWGNDPVLIINMAYANYLRGFTHWSGVLEALSVIQRDYAELYPLHKMAQVIYTIRQSLQNKAVK